MAGFKVITEVKLDQGPDLHNSRGNFSQLPVPRFPGMFRMRRCATDFDGDRYAVAVPPSAYLLPDVPVSSLRWCEFI